MIEKYCKYVKIIREKLDDYRYEHSINVAEKAAEIAGQYGADIEKAYLAGLLHDVTKNLTDEEQLHFFDTFGIMLTDAEKSSPKVWHAISASVFIKEELGIKEKDILDAVRYHTTGRADMSLLEKVVYIADFTSKDRKYPDVDVLRKIVSENLEDGVIYALSYTISSLSGKNKVIHPDTFNAYNQLLLSKGMLK